MQRVVNGFWEVKILLFGFGFSLAWELLQSPFYADTFEAPWDTIIYNRIHCSVGDVMILLSAFWIVALMWGRSWMSRAAWAPFVGFLVIGLAYTAFSENRNVEVLRSWAYSEWMPVIWGIGLSPLLQWIVVPAAVVKVVRNTSGY